MIKLATFSTISILLLSFANAQSAGERRFQEIMDGYRADGMMPSKRLSEAEARAVLADQSLRRYDVGPLPAQIVAWPSGVKVIEYYEVDTLVFPGDSLLEATTPGASPYGYPVESHLLTRHTLTPLPKDSVESPGLGTYGEPLARVRFQIASTPAFHPIYLVTRWRAVEVTSRMSFPSPSEVNGLARPKPVLPSVASALPVADQLWSTVSSPESFLERYHTVSRYGAPNWNALSSSGEIVGLCGVHAGVIEQLAAQKGVPSLVLLYLPTHTDAESHAYTALWDSRLGAWIHNPYPWEQSFIAPGPILGRSIFVRRPDTKLANHGSTRIIFTAQRN